MSKAQRANVVESGPGALDPERLAAFDREAELAKRLAKALFHDFPDGIAGYRSIHLMRHLISAHAVIARARPFTKCLRPKRYRYETRPASAYRCHKCAGCQLASALRLIDASEAHRESDRKAETA